MSLTFAGLVAEFMEARKVKGPGAALLLGVTHGALYAWLNGTSLPPRRQAERLSKKLGRADLPEIVQRERQRNRAKAKRAGAAS